MTFGSLFSGVGGLDLGLERAGLRCVWQVEKDEFCQKVLAKHWPNVKRWDDVATFTGEGFARPDVICGGFPCQDVSVAGKREGITGKRSGLWSEFSRIIRILQPRFVAVENVSALLGRGLGRVLGDLAACGYDAEWDCLPAAAFGAHHIRDRIFIIAKSSNADSMRSQGQWPTKAESWSREQFERLLQTETRLSVPAGKTGGISDGVSGRVDRLRALGNAVVPQVAEWIGRRLMQVDSIPPARTGGSE